MSWDRYAIAVVMLAGSVFVLPAASIAAAVYLGRRTRNRNANTTRGMR